MINYLILILIVIIITFFASSILTFIFFKIFSLNLKENFYLLIPILCITYWALLFLSYRHFVLNDLYQEDFLVYYLSGKQIFIDATKLYTYDYEGYSAGYIYLPCFAVLAAISISLLPLFIAPYILYLFNYITAILFILEYNKILTLMGVKEKKHRLLFLLIISNGSIVYFIFLFNQVKYLVGFLILMVLRRELKYRIENIRKDNKFYIINFGLFIFAISMAPYFLLLFLIYLFHDISRNELFERENLIKYCIAILQFFSQNFLFIIYPNLIFDYFRIFIRWNKLTLKHFYLRDLRKKFISIPDYAQTGITLILIIILYIITLILILKNNLKIERLFALFSISLIFLWRMSLRVLLVLLPLSVLLLVPFLIQNKKCIDFFKKNIYVLIGLISVFGIYYWPETTYMFVFYPGWEYSIFAIFFYLKYLIFVSIFGSVLLILHYKKYTSIDNADKK